VEPGRGPLRREAVLPTTRGLSLRLFELIPAKGFKVENGQRARLGDWRGWLHR
jgi:hypothetical protein